MSLSDRPGKSDMNRWHWRISKDKVISEDRLCGLTTHEMLHHLGLIELYKPEDCQSYPVFHGDKSNIMNRANHQKISPSHKVKSIKLLPLFVNLKNTLMKSLTLLVQLSLSF